MQPASSLAVLCVWVCSGAWPHTHTHQQQTAHSSLTHFQHPPLPYTCTHRTCCWSVDAACWLGLLLFINTAPLTCAHGQLYFSVNKSLLAKYIGWITSTLILTFLTSMSLIRNQSMQTLPPRCGSGVSWLYIQPTAAHCHWHTSASLQYSVTNALAAAGWLGCCYS